MAQENKPGTYVPLDSFSIARVMPDGSFKSTVGITGIGMDYDAQTALRDKLCVLMNANAGSLK